MTSLANLPAFLAYFLSALVLLSGFLAAYSWLTPIHEWAEIRAGNPAASLGLAGAVLGFSLPLASAIAHSVSVGDMLVWAVVALLVQLGCFAALRLLYRQVSEGLARGDMAEAIVLAAGSVTLGLINAACLS